MWFINKKIDIKMFLEVQQNQMFTWATPNAWTPERMKPVHLDFSLNYVAESQIIFIFCAYPNEYKYTQIQWINNVWTGSAELPLAFWEPCKKVKRCRDHMVIDWIDQYCFSANQWFILANILIAYYSCSNLVKTVSGDFTQCSNALNDSDLSERDSFFGIILSGSYRLKLDSPLQNE